MTRSCKNLVLFLLLFQHIAYADFDYRVENTNITTQQDLELQGLEESYVYNYNRLRFRGDFTDGALFATIIADGVNYLGDSYRDSELFEFVRSSASDTSLKTQTNFKDYGEGSAYVKLYRLYGGYEDSKNRVVAGLQNISMGVGRIWTPTNIFNHRNIYALEPDEVFGVMALSYTRYMDETSHATFVASQRADKSFKYALQYKTFLDFADLAFDFVGSNETLMVGCEIEGELADTGVLLRSEGVYIESDLKKLFGEEKEELFRGIVGADYGFENGVTMVAEALYSSKEFSQQELLLNGESEILSNLTLSHLSTGLTLSYAFNIFLDGSLLYIQSYGDNASTFVSPSLSYTLNDNNTFSLGALVQNVDGNNGLDGSDNTYYFKWMLSF